MCIRDSYHIVTIASTDATSFVAVMVNKVLAIVTELFPKALISFVLYSVIEPLKSVCLIFQASSSAVSPLSLRIVHCLTAVSYTHLDVYKRQGFN